MIETLRAVRGMNDILPDEASRWEHVEERLRELLRGYGYRNIRTPLLEPTALFRRAIGEATDIVEKEMYSFEDTLNGEHLTLRPEATASTVRAALEHSLLYNGPQRLYYIGPMFRHERPQKGRYRQFHQAGAEALGYTGPDVDAEMLVMCARLWKVLGIEDLELELNSLGSSTERAAYRASLVQYLASREGELDEDSRRRMHTNPLRVLDSKNPHMQHVIEGAPRLLDTLGSASLAHFEGLQGLLRDAGVPFRINTRLVRGLDYYNLTVFEWVSDRLGAQGTVCAGGRYDGLFEQLGGKLQPACGWAMGLERLIALLPGGQQDASAVAEVYVASQGAAAERLAFTAAEMLRDTGRRVLLHCGGGSFKSQLRKADVSGATVAVILGEEEAAAGQASVKPLRQSREQFRVSLEALGEAVAGLLREGHEAK
jgi:histidyl-tRNA synthetase